MTEIKETEINKMTKLQNYMRGYQDAKADMLSVIDDIKAEIDSLQSELTTDMRRMIRKNRVMDILNKHIADMRGAE